MDRRSFLKALLAGAAALALPAALPARRPPPARFIEAARADRYPGPVAVLAAPGGPGPWAG